MKLSGKHSSKKEVKVWNPYIRISHWVLALLLLGMYITAEFEAFDIHEYLGYAAIFLAVVRLGYGLFAGGHNSLGIKPGKALAFVRSLLKGKHLRYLTHNPLAGSIHWFMLIFVIITAATGMMAAGWMDYLGPLSPMADFVSDRTAHIVWNAHHILSEIFPYLIIVHLMGILLASLMHKENLIKSMFTGRKEARDEDMDSSTQTIIAKQTKKK